MSTRPRSNDPVLEFGRRVASRRNELGLSQAALADRLGFSSPQMVSRYECGEQEPRLTALLKLAAALSMPVADLLPGPEPSDAPADVEVLVQESGMALEALKRSPSALRLAVASLRAMAALAEQEAGESR